MASQNPSQNHHIRTLITIMMVFGFLTIPLTNVVNADEASWSTNAPNISDIEVEFELADNMTQLNVTDRTMFEIPANHTVTAANLTLSSYWNPVAYQNTSFEGNQSSDWNGTFSNVEFDSNNDAIGLQKVNTTNLLNDFEQVSMVPDDGWLASGKDGYVWTIVSNNTTLTTNSTQNLPDSGYQNSSFLSTTGTGDLNSDMESCIISPLIEVPRFINGYTLSFYHWLALDPTDGVNLSYLNENNSWTNLPLFNNQNSGASNPQWQYVNISLDNLFSQTILTTNLKFCLLTSDVAVPRGGWFIDHLELYNHGDEGGAWFHGNFSGDYLPYAASEFIIPANLTNFPYLDELEINLNWDIQGYLHDYLEVEFSFDNGSSWNIISGNYGIPGLGVWHNGNLFYSESNGWAPVYLPIIHNFSNSGGLNLTLFKFTVYTNAGINYGGPSSSGWEGIAIDQLVFHHNRGSSNAQKLLFKNFTNTPNTAIGSSDGWLQSIFPANNQWQWTSTMGVSAQHHILHSFDEFDLLPLGWSVASRDSNQWEYGEIPNNAFYGPEFWSSGQNGIGIALSGKYSNEMYTHLVSPEYTLPANASARLSFHSWACTEANWDGGAISASTDGGITWWFLPAQVGPFHDQISTANTNSPFYGEGIIDGSSISGGCRNSSLPFALKQYDISNLSGHEVRFRFSFFADQLVELDGWYLDDVGIEIDVFKKNGTWLSQPIYPDVNFGWGQIDGLVNEPTGTEVLFSVIDSSTGTVIEGYSNLTLPIELRLNPLEYPSLQIMAKLSTTDTFVTPSISILEMGVTSYFDYYHVKYLSQTQPEYQHLVAVGDRMKITGNHLDLSFSATSVCPSIDTQIISLGNNLTFQSQYYQLDYHYQQGEFMVTEFTNTDAVPTLFDRISFTMDDTSNLKHLKYTPVCVMPTENLTIGLIDDENILFPSDDLSLSDSLLSTTSLTTIETENDLATTDIYGNKIISLQASQVVNLSYPILASQPSANHLEHMESSLMVEIMPAGSGELRYLSNDSVITTYANHITNHNLRTIATCHVNQLNSLMVANDIVVNTCNMSVYATSAIDVKIIKLTAVSRISELTIALDVEQINAIKHQMENISSAPILHLPTSISSSFGSVTTRIGYQSYLHQIDRITNISRDQWLPEQEITITTTHVRFNPLTMSEAGYGLQNVELIASHNHSLAGAQFIVEVTDLSSETPTFEITSGHEKLSLNQSLSTASCDEGYCVIYWSLQSTWQLDDIDDIVWMAKSTDLDGLQTGPTVEKRETQFNEIENDLEIFELSVYDESNNDISDWTSQNWPYRLSEQTQLNVNGKVRFEGVSNVELAGDVAEVEIRLTANPSANNQEIIAQSSNESGAWTTSYYTEITDGGEFSTAIQVPNYQQLPSNTTIELSVHLSRIGPLTTINPSATDQTSPNMKTRFIFDTSSPTIASISIYDPSGLTPADGHIWTLNQDIPVQVVIEDIEGLDTELVVYTWAEYSDDVNGDSIMDAGEYRATTVSVNYASNIAVVDVPAISFQEVKGPFESGRLSIVLTINDLAGNELLNGGEFGDETDAATIIVQDQLQTLIDSSALSLDLFGENLLPAYQHTFTYSITDFNGIESLDRLTLSLVGRDKPDDCYIDYQPRFAIVDYDEQCFASQPLIKVAKISGLQKWFIETKFMIAWDAVYDNPQLSGIPSLKIFDDGQDVQLGTSYIRGLSWGVNSEIDVADFVFNDASNPQQIGNSSVVWANSNDNILASVQLLYAGTEILLTDLSANTPVECLTDNLSQPSELIAFADGRLTCEIIIPANSDNAQISVELSVASVNISRISSQSGIIHVDDKQPILLLELKDLLRLNSNQLDAVLFEGSVMESTFNSSQIITVNWNILRAGSVVNQHPLNQQISLDKTGENEYRFSDYVNLTDYVDYTILQGDEIAIWLSYQDNSGLKLSGFATENEPLLPRITWYDFLPSISLVESKTLDPVNGESLSLVTRIVNTGLESGNVTVSLVDNSGRILGSETVYLEGGRWELIDWDVEAWTTGDIEITVVLDNYSQSTSILIQDVAEFDSAQQNMMGTIGLVVIFLIIAIGGFSYAYLQRARELDQYTKHHLEQIALRKEERSLRKQPTNSSTEEE